MTQTCRHTQRHDGHTYVHTHTHIHTCVENVHLTYAPLCRFPSFLLSSPECPLQFSWVPGTQAWLMDTWWERTKRPLSSRCLLGTKSLMEILRYRSHVMINQALGSTKQPAAMVIPKPCLCFSHLCNPDLLEALWRQSGHYPLIRPMLWLFPTAQAVQSLLIHWDSSKGLVQSCASPSRTVECAITVLEQYPAKPRSLHGEVMLLSKSGWQH